MKNNESLLMHLTKNHTEVLLTGDTYYKYFLNAIKLINGKTITFEDTTILQAPHHGGGVSDTSCLGAGRSRYFKKLKQIIIPVGKNNYVHPNYPNHVDVLIPYALKKSIKIHRTDWDGHFTTKL
jgi:beta-lactamase superfamily II metal-dependent hydrolase